MIEKAIGLLRELANEKLPKWHGECDCYSVGEMKEMELKIDKFLDQHRGNKQYDPVEMIEHRGPISHKIVRQFYIAAEKLGADPELLALFGSYGDTLDDEDVLQLLCDYNETGTCVGELLVAVGDSPATRRGRFKVVEGTKDSVFFRCKCGEEIEGNKNTEEHAIICPKCKRVGCVEHLPF